MNKFKKHFVGIGLIKLLIYGFFLLFLIIPLLSVFLVAFTNQPINVFGSLISMERMQQTIDQFRNASLDNFKALFTYGGYLTGLINSLKLSFIVSLWVLVICIPIAYGIARTKMPFKKTIGALCTIPLGHSDIYFCICLYHYVWALRMGHLYLRKIRWRRNVARSVYDDRDCDCTDFLLFPLCALANGSSL